MTLPGAPLVVAGSNGHVAWGFTNSYGDWVDIERVPCTAVSAASLTTPAGTSTALSVAHEEIRVKGAAPVTLEIKSGPAGLLLKVDERAHACWFGSWLAQQPAATNLNLLDMERVRSVAEALALAPPIGMPHQNFLGRRPRRAYRLDHLRTHPGGHRPDARAAAAGRGPARADHPRIVDPPHGRLWTANARVADEPRASCS